jgi:MerR family transcriptional regulator, light-induced transcriptional regulator
MTIPGPLIRIGELSRRVDVSADRLRAWERRYGLLRPERTAGGFRLYSGADELRVRAMQRHLAAGLSAAEAAAAALSSAPEPAATPPQGVEAELGEALEAFDATRAHAIVDRLFADVGVDRAMRDVIFPFLRDLGERWACGEIHVGQEHFASGLLQGRLAALLRGGNGAGAARAVLACPPGELHTLGLLGFGIALANRDWSVTFLGADTPIATIRRTCETVAPDAVVLAAALPARFADALDPLCELAAAVPLAVAGAGAGPVLAGRVGARLLDADPVTAAARVAAGGV